ncbi:unnamed protein product (macronuclear) [Paramecium tetraurelia]|uniref:Uncharacterized protein n=1 Tax=Paramecium tetraurelia TaxID=5888 RepID=A0CGV5_PARTE|nr:uncharacterized protein GSPATT00007462001 [Paramecium tetraurelia]CAK70022.1 unnamed protein product [Paramecium tetraurelia]|eukprot:XP_001437419.1 hypothetical protein (macronuclear) [Paramecium tetraurelia strain d4-2]
MKRKQKVDQLEQTVIQKKIKKDVGKPIGLLKINIKLPDIWSVSNKEVQLITFLVNQGRHVCLHSAVLNKDLNKKKVNSIEKDSNAHFSIDEKELYDKIEVAAKFLFEWNCSKRNVVYFFRNDNHFKIKYKKSTLKNEQWTKLLKHIKFLLNEKFYEELHMILEQFENNVTDEEIGDFLISKSLIGQLSEVPQLVQNCFILLIKQNKISIQQSQITAKFLEQLKSTFLISIQQNRHLLFQSIGSIRNIMYDNCQSESYISDSNSVDYDLNQEIFFNSTSY